MQVPAPVAAQIKPSALAGLAGAGLEPSETSSLADVLANLFAEVLASFVARSQILPGIIAVVNPLTTQGKTIGPGLLMPPPTGGPHIEEIEAMARAKLSGAGYEDEALEGWVDVLTHTCVYGLVLTCTVVQMEKNVSVDGMVTSSTAKLE